MSEYTVLTLRRRSEKRVVYSNRNSISYQPCLSIAALDICLLFLDISGKTDACLVAHVLNLTWDIQL